MNGEFTNPRCKRLQLQPTRRMPVEPGRRERSDFGSSIMTGVKCSAGGEAIAAPDESRNGPMPVRTRTPRTIGAEEGPPRQGLSRPGESSRTRAANVCSFNPTDQENTGRARPPRAVGFRLVDHDGREVLGGRGGNCGSR
jgi:hypothetical protein